MKIEINYDLMHKIQGANGQYKIYRKMLETKTSATLTASMFFTLDLCDGKLNSTIPNFLLSILISQTLVASNLAIVDGKKDILKSLYELKRLANVLNRYINTSDILLKESEEYFREYDLNFNENGMLYLLQKKYIYIPTYNDGTIEYNKTSIMQEHEIYLLPPISNKKYVLSMGTPQKVFKPSFAGI